MLCFDSQKICSLLALVSAVSAVPSGFRPDLINNARAEVGRVRHRALDTSTSSLNLVGVCGINAGLGPSCAGPSLSTSTNPVSTSTYSLTNTAVSTNSSPASAITSAAAGSSVSCEDSDYWAPTVSNWAEEGVDAKLSSWALNLVPNPPTAVSPGSYPTQLPPPFTGFGNTSEYPQVVGIAGQLMSIAIPGKDASCSLVDGPNGQCGDVTIPEACGNMPRWAYLAWKAIYNMFSIHAQINAVVLDSEAFQLGQAPEVLKTFLPQQSSTSSAIEILLTILGSLVTIVGVLIPLSAVGGAAIMELENAGLVAATSESGLLGRIGANLGKDGGEGGEAGDTADPDAIVSSGQPAVPAGGVTDPPPQIQPAAPPTPIGGSTPVVVRPGGNTPKVNNPTFIGNVLWVAPGIMTTMSNGVWQESKAATNPEAKSDLNSEAVVDYLTNASAVLISYNDALLTQNDNASIQNFLAVLAGGSFIETNWSQAIFETALSADVISRQINTAWQSPSVGGTYVSYTQLHDNVNGTICNSTHIGVRSTQVCADTGVYYLNMLDTTGWYPTIVGPPGFSDMMTFGIMPWWPVSASATAYRLMNPDGNVVPPIITTTNDSIFADFMSDFAATDTYEIVSSIGQMPGSWSFPICDQGSNFWMTDWSNTGGYTTNNENYSPMPCSCGYQGSGTEAFYKAVGADNAVINWAYSTCLTLLNAVDPVLALTSENIGWNAISGGPPPKEIVYGSGLAIQVPNTMPKPCYAGTSNCGHINPPTTHGT